MTSSRGALKKEKENELVRHINATMKPSQSLSPFKGQSLGATWVIQIEERCKDNETGTILKGFQLINADGDSEETIFSGGTYGSLIETTGNPGIKKNELFTSSNDDLTGWKLGLVIGVCLLVVIAIICAIAYYTKCHKKAMVKVKVMMKKKKKERKHPRGRGKRGSSDAVENRPLNEPQAQAQVEEVEV